MKKNILLLLFSILPQFLISQPNNKVIEHYQEAFNYLNSSLNTDTISFKKAVFTIENAYFDNELDYSSFNTDINFLTYLIERIYKTHSLEYDAADKEKVSKNAAIFRLMTDTVVMVFDSAKITYHSPFTYDFEDMWGEKEWSNMFVTKLLATHKGNCHSLPFLYKILADELGVEAHLALAPNHIYIKTKSEKYGWYNTELTSGMFPIDAWIMASGYIHLNAIQNRLYMSALDDKQSIAICMTDLAEGYARKTDFTDPDFVIMCCDTALKHFPNYVNATLLKIKMLKHQFETELAKPQPDKEVSDKLFAEIERLSIELYKLGYRQMPKEMYLDWLVSLKTEKEKYTNRQIMNEEKK